MHGICVELCGIRTVYARYTHGIRWYTVVAVWYTHGIRVVYGWYFLLSAWYTHGIRVVYAWYTRGIRVELCGIRTVYARNTLVYASGCGLISAAQNRRFQGDTLYTSGMLCLHHAIHWKGTSI